MQVINFFKPIFNQKRSGFLAANSTRAVSENFFVFEFLKLISNIGKPNFDQHLNKFKT
jgi:hypothetical protein